MINPECINCGVDPGESCGWAPILRSQISTGFAPESALTSAEQMIKKANKIRTTCVDQVGLDSAIKSLEEFVTQQRQQNP